MPRSGQLIRSAAGRRGPLTSTLNASNQQTVSGGRDPVSASVARAAKETKLHEHLQEIIGVPEVCSSKPNSAYPAAILTLKYELGALLHCTPKCALRDATRVRCAQTFGLTHGRLEQPGRSKAIFNYLPFEELRKPSYSAMDVLWGPGRLPSWPSNFQLALRAQPR